MFSRVEHLKSFITLGQGFIVFASRIEIQCGLECISRHNKQMTFPGQKNASHTFCHLLSHLLMFLGSLYCKKMDTDDTASKGAV